MKRIFLFIVSIIFFITGYSQIANSIVPGSLPANRSVTRGIAAADSGFQLQPIDSLRFSRDSIGMLSRDSASSLPLFRGLYGYLTLDWRGDTSHTDPTARATLGYIRYDTLRNYFYTELNQLVVNGAGFGSWNGSLSTNNIYRQFTTGPIIFSAPETDILQGAFWKRLHPFTTSANINSFIALADSGTFSTGAHYGSLNIEPWYNTGGNTDTLYGILVDGQHLDPSVINFDAYRSNLSSSQGHAFNHLGTAPGYLGGQFFNPGIQATTDTTVKTVVVNSSSGLYSTSSAASGLTIEDTSGHTQVGVNTIQVNTGTGLFFKYVSPGISQLLIESGWGPLIVPGQTTVRPNGEDSLNILHDSTVNITTNNTTGNKSLTFSTNYNNINTLSAQDFSSYGYYADPPTTSQLIMPNQNFYNTPASPIITYRSNHVIDRYMTVARFLYVNQSQTGTATNPFTVTASYYIAPTASSSIATLSRHIITFGGSQSVTIPPTGYVWSDPMPVFQDATNGAFIIALTCCNSSASSNMWPIGITLVGGFQGQSTGDQTQVNNPTFGSGTTSYCPAMISSPQAGNRISIFVSGTSITDGSNDATNNRGWVGMLTSDSLIGTNITLNRAAEPGETLTTVLGSGYYPNYRYIFSLHATQWIVDYGTNDLYLPTTSFALESLFVAYWGIGAKQNKKIYQTTILPRVTIGADPTVISGQTPGIYDTARISVNTWLRSGAPCSVSGTAPFFTYTPVAVGTSGAIKCPYLFGLLDNANVVEANSSNVLTQNGGYWLVGATLLTSTVTSATSSSITDASANYNALSLPVAGCAVKITGGTGSGQINWIIGAQTNTQINMLNAWSTLPDATSTYTIINAPTRDGIHPNTNQHRMIENSAFQIIKNFKN